MKHKNSIALCMIVKNESHVILQTLENLLEKVGFEYWVISDTGSTDNTKELITEFFKEKNVPGELHEDEWKDFGHNRSLAFEYGFSAPVDYLFIFDADDRINGNLQLSDLNKLLHPTLPTQFSLHIGTGFTYTRPFIFHNDHKWKFYGVLHEYAALAEEGPTYSCIVNGDYHVDSRREGARSKDPLKYQKDAEVLDKAYHEECKKENSKFKSRYAFYCANSYKDCNNDEKAVEFYKIRTTLGDYQEEVYLSYLYGGRCMIKLERPEEEIEEFFLKGWESMRNRSECLHALAFYLRMKKKFTKAYVYAELGRKIPFPPECRLFVERDIFDLKILDECAVSAFYTQRFDVCFKLNGKLLQKFYDERLVKNMEFCVPPLRQKAIIYNNYNFVKPKNRYYGVTLTMTTCKRYDLFEQTVNSLLNNVKDLYMIERFICIDDNSSHEDRVKMMDKYPFFEFMFKKPNQKGHVVSMNMLKKKLTDEDKFIFHLEDDFVFLSKRNYIGKSVRILKDNPQLGQVLFNRNYAETLEQYRIGGGNPILGGKYLLHEYVPEPAKRKQKISCEYWPHFSFRPSIIKKEVFDKVGDFVAVPHFEMAYANKYVEAGFVSCFHNRVDLLHIGKLTNQNGDNAYSLNDVKQF
jgi:glycosyltransferase involved in cell wall biosynthesis